MESFATRLKHLRKDVLKYSMKKIATEMNTNQSSFSQYEKGSVRPGLSFIQALSEKYDVSANWLILGITPIMIKDLNTKVVDTTELIVVRQKAYEDKLSKISNELKEAVEEYKRKG